MPLSVAEVEVNDLPGIANLWLAAHSTINPVERLIYPLGPTPSITTSCLAQEKREFLQPSTRYLKIVDSDRLADQEGAQPETSPGDDGRSEGLEDGTGTGKAAVVPEDRGSISSMIVAFVRFKLWSSDQDASDWDQPYSVSEGELGAIGDINVDIARSFRGQQKRMSRTYIKGRKCIYIQRLATHLSYQHLGAATMLLSRVKDVARRSGLDILLQATPSGYPLYRKLGFEDVAAFEVDLGVLAGGGEEGRPSGGERYRNVLMRLKLGVEQV